MLFRNLLKRMDQGLYHHLFESLMLDDSVWVFKWFITLYLYSFPLQVIRYVWDMVVEMGGIALVYFAVALVLHLKAKMMKVEDFCDMSEFLQTLKTLETFN
jgi:hypothetical protein